LVGVKRSIDLDAVATVEVVDAVLQPARAVDGTPFALLLVVHPRQFFLQLLGRTVG